MGRETHCTAHWQGRTGQVRLHLDSGAFELSGDIRLRIARADLGSATVEGGRLTLSVGGEMLTLELGAADAAKWHAALLKAPPTLAAKLGVSAATPAFLHGDTDDPQLLHALDGATVPNPEDARLVVALVASVADLDAACAVAGSRPLWVVTGKGRHATVRETDLRTELRARGFGDSKSCAVSEQLTATRWQQRA
jgi:hypothetical protein